MKRILLALAVILFSSTAAMAQKYALIDMDYILKNIPQYEMANEQLDQISKRWQAEVEALARKLGYNPDQYDIRISFVPVGFESDLDYAITFN